MLQLLKLIVLTCLSLTSLSQTSFNWSDTSFKVNSKHTLFLDNDFDGPCSSLPCYEQNKLLYDTIFNFLKAHPKIKIEIVCNTYYGKDFGPDDEWNKIKADYIRSVLIKMGIKLVRIISKGNDDIHRKNTFSEIIITSI